MVLPSDTRKSDWSADNLRRWSAAEIRALKGTYQTGKPYSVELAPLEAKALHVFGMLTRTFDVAGHALYFGEWGPYSDYYLHAYWLACSAVELLSRCRNGDPDLTRGSDAALERGLKMVGLEAVRADGEVYDPSTLVALRNLAAHGQAVDARKRRNIAITLTTELLDPFPSCLMQAFDRYYLDVFRSDNPGARRRLAASGVEPLHCSSRWGLVFDTPIRYAYENIFQPQVVPSAVLSHRDWRLSKG